MLNTVSRIVLLVGVSTALSGCLLTRNEDFNQAAKEAQTIGEEIGALPTVAAEDLPDTGSATYEGIAALNYDERLEVGSENNDYFADITFETDFETGEVDGSMTNFQTPDGAVGGELVFTDGQVSSNGVNGDFEGTIDDDGTEVTISADVDSDFRGDGTGNPAGLTGTIDGDYTTDDESGEIFGSFVTEITSD